MPNTQQPTAGFDYQNDWSNGLFECCTDMKALICAYFCLPCFLCELDKAAGVINWIIKKIWIYL